MSEGAKYQKGDKLEFIIRDQPRQTDYNSDRKKEQTAIGVVDNVSAHPTGYTVYFIDVPHGKRAGLHIVEERDILSKK
jgi:hypothetical protein